MFNNTLNLITPKKHARQNISSHDLDDISYLSFLDRDNKQKIVSHDWEIREPNFFLYG